MVNRRRFSTLIAQHLIDPRATNTQFPLADLVRQSVYRRLAGYENVNDGPALEGTGVESSNTRRAGAH